MTTLRKITYEVDKTRHGNTAKETRKIEYKVRSKNFFL